MLKTFIAVFLFLAVLFFAFRDNGIKIPYDEAVISASTNVSFPEKRFDANVFDLNTSVSDPSFLYKPEADTLHKKFKAGLRGLEDKRYTRKYRYCIVMDVTNNPFPWKEYKDKHKNDVGLLKEFSSSNHSSKTFIIACDTVDIKIINPTYMHAKLQ